MVCYIYFKINGRELMINEDDCEDVKILTRWKRWRKLTIHVYPNTYKHICVGKKKMYLHRITYYAYNQDWDIYDSSKDNKIDHINNTPSDCNINNLRIVTARQNCYNQKTTKGYDWCKIMKKWRARIRIEGKETRLGYYSTEEEARESYLTAKLKYHVIIK